MRSLILARRLIVLDTSVLSLAFRRRPGNRPPPPEALEVHALVTEGWPLVVPGIVYQELLSGVRGRRAARDLEGALQGFDILLADREAHRQAADISTSCGRRGVTTSAVDCLIAAQAIRLGAALFSADADFTAMSRHCPLRLHAPRRSG